MRKIISHLLRVSYRKPYSFIEPKIRPVVDSMNSTGVITTIASCEGHGLSGKPPYIYFNCQTNVAAALAKVLRENMMSEKPSFRKEWVVEGCFNEKYHLTFLLYSPTYHRKAFSLWALLNFGAFRKRLDAELLTLADLVTNADLSHLGECDVVEVAKTSDDNYQPYQTPRPTRIASAP